MAQMSDDRRRALDQIRALGGEWPGPWALDPSESRQVRMVDGRLISYQCFGEPASDKPVLLHFNGMSSGARIAGTMRDLAEAADIQTVVFDASGVGSSDPFEDPDQPRRFLGDPTQAFAVLNDLGVGNRPRILTGHSLGCHDARAAAGAGLGQALLLLDLSHPDAQLHFGHAPEIPFTPGFDASELVTMRDPEGLRRWYDTVQTPVMPLVTVSSSTALAPWYLGALQRTLRAADQARDAVTDATGGLHVRLTRPELGHWWSWAAGSTAGVEVPPPSDNRVDLLAASINAIRQMWQGQQPDFGHSAVATVRYVDPPAEQVARLRIPRLAPEPPNLPHGVSARYGRLDQARQPGFTVYPPSGDQTAR